MAIAETRPDAGRADDAGQQAPVLFDAVLTPSRSLSPRAARRVLMGVFAATAAAGLVFLSHGWWPIAGYFGLDALLLAWAFRACRRAGRLVERLRLTADALVVARVRPDGAAMQWSFQPTWLRVEMDDPPTEASQLTLASHGRRLGIGRFLTPGERLEVARALRTALHRARQPTAS
jgi:uncharacterized membrane protein